MAVVNIPGAYVSADMDEEVFVIFCVIMAELMVASNPTLYCKYISYRKKVEALMYVRVQKALYGCLKNALIFYERLVGDLEAHGIKINPYDLCVVNKTVEGKHPTITLHVDESKISHFDRKVISDTIVWLESIYGKMRGTCDKRHEYFGMSMEYPERGEVKISM